MGYGRRSRWWHVLVKSEDSWVTGEEVEGICDDPVSVSGDGGMRRFGRVWNQFALSPVRIAATATIAET